MSRLLVTLMLLLPAAAQASPVYTQILEEETGADCTPGCTVCHASLHGGEGTVVQPFGEALVARGLTGGSDYERLQELVAEIAAAGQDTSGDGTPDVDALAAGLDPNPGGVSFCEFELPTYGCFSHTGHAPGLALAMMAGLLTLLRRTRP